MDWESYLPFCQSERQREIIQLRAEGLSAEKVSESIGIARRTILATCARVKANAAKQGYSPDHDMIHTVPDGFTVSGTSTLYKDGTPLMQWVKSKNDAVAIFEEALEHFKEGLLEDVQGRSEPVSKPKG
jgi:hypothetical protein